MSNILFVTEKLGSPTQKGSTILAEAGLKRGHRIFECLPQDVSLLNGKVIAKCFEYKKTKPAQKILATDFEVIHFRANPPVDIAYLTTLYLLRLIENDVLIINRPSAIVNFPEKIFPHHFAKFSPPTLITSEQKLAGTFIKKHKQVVAKPLYDSGGRGVVKIDSTKNLAKILTGNQQIILQKFLPEIADGDKRIFFLGNKIMGAFLRRPAKGSILSNIAQGGTALPVKLTKKQFELCKTLGRELEKNGIMLCGIDMIGNYITEINITSPIGFAQISELYGLKIEEEIWKKIESIIK